MVNVPPAYEPLDENEANYQAFRTSLVRAATLMVSLQAAGDIKEGMRVTELEHLQLEKSDINDYLKWIDNAAKKVLELLDASPDPHGMLTLCLERAREIMLSVGILSEDDRTKKTRAGLVLQGLILGMIKLRDRVPKAAAQSRNPLVVQDLARLLIDPDTLAPTDAAVRAIISS